jgi:uncharacterized protein
VAGLDIGLFASLAAIAMAAGFVDAIAGGGGLLTVPALLLFGFDPVAAVATNKLQGTFGTASATLTFARARLIDWRDALPMAAAAFVGAVGGAMTVKLLPTSVLLAVMPALLVAMAIYFALSKKLKDEDARRRIAPLAFTASIAIGVGFYDGLFGPAAGSFYLLGFVTLLGFGVRRATAHTKLLNFASNLGSLMLFIMTGAVVWPAGLAMAAGSLAGAQIGSRLALRHGARLVRPLLVLVSCAMALKLLLDPANALRRLLLAAVGW